MNCLINPVDTLTRIEYHGLPVLTTAQLAECLSTPVKTVTINNLQSNFRNNRERFVEGEDYFKLEGEELASFRDHMKNFQTVVAPRTSTLYLWTEYGCLYHCKSVNTDVAWEVYKRLVKTYFNVKQLVQDKPLPSISNYKLAIAATKLAAHAEDPYEKRKLVVKAANLLFGEEFLPEPPKPVVQMTLFK